MMMRVKKTPPLRKKGEKEYLSLIFFNSSQEKMGTDKKWGQKMGTGPIL
jgi:hypothetical protein